MLRYVTPLMGWVLLLSGCLRPGAAPSSPTAEAVYVNLGHLDHLGEVVLHRGDSLRLVRIYAEAPDYRWVGDDDEGVACVDDAARAAVVYLRHFELTAEAASRRKAEQLLRFVLYMQVTDGSARDGLFYNFVWDPALRINTEHPNSRADVVEWWTARAVWALGVGARVLKEVNPALAESSRRSVARTRPHLQRLLERYGETADVDGRTVPQWLLRTTAADATSELLLGLVALQHAYPDAARQAMINQFAEGIALMRYGSMTAFPYGGHASWAESWHGWGNSQTQALAEAGFPDSGVAEAEQFYSRLLVEGWLHAIDYASGEVRVFEQIAYDVRPAAVGLLRLAGTTGKPKYAEMAGLAASWFTGNNAASAVMYDPATGRGYDGILSPTEVNWNAGAESTIEALMTIQEVLHHPTAAAVLQARGQAPQSAALDGVRYRYRLFDVEAGARRAVVMNLAEGRTDLLSRDELSAFLRRVASGAP